MAKKKSVASILRRIKRSAKRIPKTRAQKEAFIKGMAKRMDKNPTTPEKAFAEILKELNIKYETQKIVEGKIYDFYIPEKNLLVEVDGNYWHSKDKELCEMSAVQKKIYFNDLRKDAIAKKMGYELERVWEQELSEQYELTKSRFKYILTD